VGTAALRDGFISQKSYLLDHVEPALKMVLLFIVMLY
jgi:hypothetical protein